MPIKRIQRGRNHGYTINGNKAIGVTTALSKGLPKPNLLAWAARCAAEEAVQMMGYDDIGMDLWFTDQGVTDYNQRDKHLLNYLKNAHIRKRDHAAVRGTKVHAIAERLVLGDEVEVPEELIGHVQSCAQFMTDWKVRPLLVENVVGSYQWGFAGTFDLVGELPDGRRVLFDYKTGASGIWPETALQLAAYRNADTYVASDGTEIPMKEVGITECKAVWVRADGYDVIPLNTDAAVFKAFLHILQVAKNVDHMGGWVGPAETPSVSGSSTSS